MYVYAGILAFECVYIYAFMWIWFVLISIVLTVAWSYIVHCDVFYRMKVTNSRLVWVHLHAVVCVPLRASTLTPSVWSPPSWLRPAGSLRSHDPQWTTGPKQTGWILSDLGLCVGKIMGQADSQWWWLVHWLLYRYSSIYQSFFLPDLFAFLHMAPRLEATQVPDIWPSH